MKSCTLLFVFFLGVCWAEIEIPNIPMSLDDIPEIKRRCEEKGKSDTYERVKIAINETRTCLEGQISPSKIKEELEEAKKTGSMDEVFGKYCNKRQDYKNCIFKTVNVTKECLEEVEINHINSAVKVIEEIADFACYRDGDRLAMFVAEGGVECVSSRTEQIKDCVNGTFKIDTSNLSLTSLPTLPFSLKIDKDKCDKLSDIQQCVVNDLESNCKDTTPANIVDALFKYVKKLTCKNIKKRSMLEILL
ncbi:27 kDa glycoprotein [Dendroctonus ponderosae]|uniref:27 kDa glycoprotein n=1 Tax=Dendroctonus ponderosae TaxID=77166 RepID=UPI002035795F|nr:27 kDa glycoprotein [Dendroctonus ponderosae]